MNAGITFIGKSLKACLKSSPVKQYVREILIIAIICKFPNINRWPLTNRKVSFPKRVLSDVWSVGLLASAVLPPREVTGQHSMTGTLLISPAAGLLTWALQPTDTAALRKLLHLQVPPCLHLSVVN